MKQTQLVSVIKKQLSFFNVLNINVGDDTPIQNVLVEEDTRKLFRGNVLWTIHNATKQKKTMPAGWLAMTPGELATKLMLFLILFIGLGFTTAAQVKVTVGGVRTETNQAAIAIGFNYLKSLDSLYGGKEAMIYGKRSWIMVTPEVDFQTGGADALNGITGKATAMITKFRTTVVDGIETPDADKVLHVFPVSVGAESNNRFNFVNGIVEAGYTPYYQSVTSNLPHWLKRTKLGVFLQTGYKFGDSSNWNPDDQSQEAMRSGILRARGSFSINTRDVITVDAFRVGIVGKTNVWYDFVNRKFHSQIVGTARLRLTPTMFVDVEYQKGSGAPNFNDGDQFGTGLSILF